MDWFRLVEWWITRDQLFSWRDLWCFSHIASEASTSIESHPTNTRPDLHCMLCLSSVAGDLWHSRLRGVPYCSNNTRRRPPSSHQRFSGQREQPAGPALQRFVSSGVGFYVLGFGFCNFFQWVFSYFFCVESLRTDFKFICAERFHVCFF